MLNQDQELGHTGHGSFYALHKAVALLSSPDLVSNLQKILSDHQKKEELIWYLAHRKKGFCLRKIIDPHNRVFRESIFSLGA